MAVDILGSIPSVFFSIVRDNFKGMGHVQSHRTRVQKGPAVGMRLYDCCLGIIDNF